MSEFDQTAIVRRYSEEVLNQGRPEVFDELADKRFVSYLAYEDGIDAETYKQILAGTLSALADLRVTIEDQIAADDKVVTRWQAMGTPRVEFAGIKPNGGPVTVTAVHIHLHRLRNGRLTEHREASNLHAVQQG